MSTSIVQINGLIAIYLFAFFNDTSANILIVAEALRGVWTNNYMFRTGRSSPCHEICESVKLCQVNKCKDEKGLRKASVLGTGFCSSAPVGILRFTMLSFHGHKLPEKMPALWGFNGLH